MAYLQTKNPLDYTEETTGSTSGNIAQPALTNSMTIGTPPVTTKAPTAAWGGTPTGTSANTTIATAAPTPPATTKAPTAAWGGSPTVTSTTKPLKTQYGSETGWVDPSAKETGVWNTKSTTDGVSMGGDIPQPIFIAPPNPLSTAQPTATVAPNAQQYSGMFNNLQSYLGTNQASANTMGAQLAGSISGHNTEATTALNNAKAAFMQKVKAGTTSYNPQLLEAYLNNPTAYANDPQVKAMLSGSYSGPSTFDDAATIAAMQKAIETGTLSKDIAGREQLMRNIAPGGIGGAGGALNQFLVQNTDPAMNQVTNASTNINKIGDTYSAEMKSMGTAAGDAIKNNQSVQQKALARVNQIQAAQQAATAQAAQQAAAKKQAEQEAANKKIMDDFLAKVKAAQTPTTTTVAPITNTPGATQTQAPTKLQGTGTTATNPTATAPVATQAPKANAVDYAPAINKEWFQQAMGRPGTAEELKYWNDKLNADPSNGGSTVYHQFLASAKQGQGIPTNPTAPKANAVDYAPAINKEWFQSTMGRPGTAEELKYWNDKLNADPSNGGATVHNQFLASAKQGQGIPTGAPGTNSTQLKITPPPATKAPAIKVDYAPTISKDWYQKSAGHPGAPEELKFWSDQLNADPSKGAQVYENFTKYIENQKLPRADGQVQFDPATNKWFQNVVTQKETGAGGESGPTYENVSQQVQVKSPIYLGGPQGLGQDLFLNAMKNPGGVKDANNKGIIYTPPTQGVTDRDTGITEGEPTPGGFYRNNQNGTGSLFTENGQYLGDIPEGTFITFKDALKMAAPVLLAAFGVPAMLANGIGAATGLGLTASQIAAGAMIGGGLSGLSGGSVWKGALAGGLGAGINAAGNAMFGDLPAPLKNAFVNTVTSVARGQDPTQALLSGGLSAVTSQIPGFNQLGASQQAVINNVVASAIKNGGNMTPEALMGVAFNAGLSAMKGNSAQNNSQQGGA